MDRRNALKGLSVMFGAALLAPIRDAIAQGLDPLTMRGATLFDDLLRDDTAALAETIIPETVSAGGSRSLPHRHGSARSLVRR